VYNLCIQNETKVPEQPGPFGENSSQRSKTIKKKKKPQKPTIRLQRSKKLDFKRINGEVVHKKYKSKKKKKKPYQLLNRIFRLFGLV
jgi:hypothetical protein